METRLQRLRYYAKSLERPEDRCVRPKGIRKGSVFFQQKKRWKGLPMKLIILYALFYYFKYFLCLIIRSPTVLSCDNLHKIHRYQIYQGLLLAKFNRENSPYWVLIQVQTEIPNFVHLGLCVSSVFPYLNISLCNSLINV
jgi:hypothetical protein